MTPLILPGVLCLLATAGFATADVASLDSILGRGLPAKTVVQDPVRKEMNGNWEATLQNSRPRRLAAETLDFKFCMQVDSNFEMQFAQLLASNGDTTAATALQETAQLTRSGAPASLCFTY